ncbi:hypothetical protein GQ600_26730 [Phytophthora cactorum]|nr:hypothetical protein GQ600_26730 [Phytophthora cactorum]
MSGHMYYQNLSEVHGFDSHSYRHLDALHEIAASGARVPLARELPQQNSYPASHKSADERYSVLIKSIRKEKNQWRCFVVDVNILELRHEVHISPFGLSTRATLPTDDRQGHPRSSIPRK